MVALEVAGYNEPSYYLLDQPSFLQAEVEIDGECIAATGRNFCLPRDTIPPSRRQAGFYTGVGFVNKLHLWSGSLLAAVIHCIEDIPQRTECAPCGIGAYSDALLFVSAQEIPCTDVQGCIDIAVVLFPARERTQAVVIFFSPCT